MDNSFLHIFSDGSGRNSNGLGGVGVYASPIEFYYNLGLSNTTTSRCELYGVLFSLQIALENKNLFNKIFIYCDNQYAINVIAKGWAKNWEKTGWKNRINSDIIREILRIYRLCSNTQLIWVRGHQKDNSFISLGNSIADRLADYKQFDHNSLHKDFNNLDQEKLRIR